MRTLKILSAALLFLATGCAVGVRTPTEISGSIVNYSEISSRLQPAAYLSEMQRPRSPIAMPRYGAVAELPIAPDGTFQFSGKLCESVYLMIPVQTSQEVTRTIENGRTIWRFKVTIKDPDRAAAERASVDYVVRDFEDQLEKRAKRIAKMGGEEKLGCRVIR